jgi:hypothetical protein
MAQIAASFVIVIDDTSKAKARARAKAKHINVQASITVVQATVCVVVPKVAEATSPSSSHVQFWGWLCEKTSST